MKTKYYVHSWDCKDTDYEGYSYTKAARIAHAYGSCCGDRWIDEKEVISTKEELIDTVYSAYMEDDQEFSSAFFDLNVYMKKGSIVKAYAELQNKINGDTVVYHFDKKEANKMWDGNCREFLETLNDLPGFERWINYEGGAEPEKVDFIF